MAKFTVRGKNIEATPALKEYVEKRVGRVSRFFDGVGDIVVALTVEKGKHIVEVTIHLGNMILRGEESTNDMYTSIDLVTDKLERQIEKYKAKMEKRYRGSIKDVALAETSPQTEAITDEFVIKKTKRFAIKPMDVQEAIMQMNLVNHDFYVFMNAETEEVNVVYRRKDGAYGLIEPEY